MTTVPFTTKISYWPFALAIALVPWLVFGFKLVVVAFDAPLPVVEAAISSILYSVPLSFFGWLALTLFSVLRGGLRQGFPALMGLAPLGAMYAVIVLGSDR